MFCAQLLRSLRAFLHTSILFADVAFTSMTGRLRVSNLADTAAALVWRSLPSRAVRCDPGASETNCVVLLTGVQPSGDGGHAGMAARAPGPHVLP